MNVTSDIVNGEIGFTANNLDANALKRVRSTAALDLAVRSIDLDGAPVSEVINRAEAFLKFIS